MKGYNKAIKSLWKGKCTVIIRGSETDPDTEMERTVESVLMADEPCRISFQSIAPAGNGPVPTIVQNIKLFVSADKEIPAGSKITVTQEGRTVDYTRSGLPAIYSVHQEIPLELFKKWA